MKNLISCIIAFFAISGCAPKAQHTGTSNNAIPAFPGAEGFGEYTTGGRGGKVIIVTNLNDDGPGSLRAALSTKEPAFVVFETDGTIHLKTPLEIHSNTTVAGQSAPGDGICLADQTVQLKGDNIIVRYMRFRMGDRYQDQGKVDGAGGDDAFGGTKRNNIIIDHCSMSWSTDEVFSVYAGDSVTLQWNLISEPLNYSYHFEKGDDDFEHHGFGAIWGGLHASFHHNLFAHCNNRTPRFNGIRHTKIEFCDYRNNVIYNWGNNNVYAGEGGVYNIVNNYYKPGPSTSTNAKKNVANPYKREDIPFGKWFIAGNVNPEFPDVTANNWIGVKLEKGDEADLNIVRQMQPFETGNVKTESAEQAYISVLQHVGASFRRDTLDQRVINDVRNKTGRIIDVQGGYPHGTAYEVSKSAWPLLKTGQALKDTDRDGIPDDWELKHGLNPNDASDAVKTASGSVYTNIEVYVNSLLK